MQDPIYLSSNIDDGAAEVNDGNKEATESLQDIHVSELRASQVGKKREILAHSHEDG
jgi:hypothetical protein